MDRLTGHLTRDQVAAATTDLGAGIGQHVLSCPEGPTELTAAVAQLLLIDEVHAYTAAVVRRTAAARQRLLDAVCQQMSVPQVAGMLGISRQALDKARRRPHGWRGKLTELWTDPYDTSDEDDSSDQPPRTGEPG